MILFSFLHGPSNVTPTLLQTKASSVSFVKSFFNETLETASHCIYREILLSHHSVTLPRLPSSVHSGLPPLTPPATLSASFSTSLCPLRHLHTLPSLCLDWPAPNALPRWLTDIDIAA